LDVEGLMAVLQRLQFFSAPGLVKLDSSQLEDCLTTLSNWDQRLGVEFARALVLEPRVVLLDEPTLGLDPRASQLVFDSTQMMQRLGATVLMVEQNVRFGLSLATHATVLTAGTVALSGTAAEIAAHPDLMDLFFGATGPNGALIAIHCAQNRISRAICV